MRIAGLTERDKLRNELFACGIETGVHYRPNHLLSRFRPTADVPLPVTEAVFPELLTLPLHTDLSDADIEYVCESLRSLTQ